MKERRYMLMVRTAAFGLVFSLLSIQGCESPQASEAEGRPGGSANQASYWQAAPVRLRVYPSTRFVKEKGRSILEARLELLDQMGDPIKASGLFRIELYRVDESLGNAPQRLLYTWTADTLTLELQREHYDPITRGYLFRLGVDDIKIAGESTFLKVAFTPEVGPRLDAEAVIRLDW